MQRSIFMSDYILYTPISLKNVDVHKTQFFPVIPREDQVILLRDSEYE